MNQSQRRRPLGLKKATESKKLKQEQESQEDQTVWLQGGEEAGDDEVSEAAILLKNATAMIADDVDKARLLLQGTIHECDRILRNATDDAPLPVKFYATYALALCELGELMTSEATEEAIGFIQLADDFAQQGLTMAEQQSCREQYEMHMTNGRVRISQARTKLYQAEQDNDDGDELTSGQLVEIDKLVEAANEYFTTALQLKKSAINTGDNDLTAYIDAVQMAANLLQVHADLRDDWHGREKWNMAAIELLKMIGDENSVAFIYQTIGIAYMSQANWWLDRDDADDDGDMADDDEEKGKSTAKKIIEYLQQAKFNFTLAIQQAETNINTTPLGPILVQLAECEINLGNTASNEEDESAYYTSAVEHLKQTVESGHNLPEQLASFLTEWEADDNDSM